MFTTDTSYGALKKVCKHLRACDLHTARPIDPDAAIRATTAFTSLADALDTQPHYAPKFCLSRTISSGERAQIIYAAKAFNQAAERLGQSRRAMFF